MARPHLLIQEDLLSEIWYKHTQGVPVLLLIREYKLEVTPPTLTKLLSYMTAMESAVDEDVRGTIYASLFPEWLISQEDRVIASQPHKMKYRGKMPLGEWAEG